MNNNLIEVFQDTVRIYNNEYADYTRELKNNDTIVYTKSIGNILKIVPNDDMKVSVVNGGTVEIGKKLALDDDVIGKVAILNFADGIEPGGLVLVGETTQEENICRCSNLYASITTDKAWNDYYDYNAQYYGIYSDRIIYSRNVMFFKNDVTYEREEPYFMDVITCPSPSQKILDKQIEHDILYTRIEEILKSAMVNGVQNIVLGAWGCGAFGQSPYVISRCFAEALAKYPVFNNVVFAIRSCRADTSKALSNYDVFCETFSK